MHRLGVTTLKCPGRVARVRWIPGLLWRNFSLLLFRLSKESSIPN